MFQTKEGLKNKEEESKEEEEEILVITKKKKTLTTIVNSLQKANKEEKTNKLETCTVSSVRAVFKSTM